MVKKALTTLILILITAFIANATSSLTGDQVERVLATLKALEPYSDQMDAELDQSGDMDSGITDPELYQKECVRIYRYSAQAQKVIEDHGFTAQTWPETAGRVLKAMTYLAMQEESAGGFEEMKAALAQIEANPNMTPEQKQMMRQQVQAAVNTVETMMKAPEGDVEAVRPYYNEFAAEME